jgi:2-phospho-L-lactate guanylyltransferase
LAADFDESARTRLTLAMLADMVAAARAARAVDAVYVVSGDAALLDHAQAFGAHTLVETPGGRGLDVRRAHGHGAGADAEPRGGLNRAVFHAASGLAERGVARLLTIPGDVPLIAPAEIDELFAEAASSSVVLVPSASGSGTNGLLTAPPSALCPQFEGESLAAHQRACRAAGLAHAVRPAPGFALDIDTIDDLRTLVRCGAERQSARVAAELLTHDAGDARPAVWAARG